MDNSPFNDLSAELRINIYELVVVEPDGISIDITGGLSPRMQRCGGAEKLLAITETCKQMRQEIMPIFTGKNQFRIVPSVMGQRSLLTHGDEPNEEARKNVEQVQGEREQLLRPRCDLLSSWAKNLRAYKSGPASISISFDYRGWERHTEWPADTVAMAIRFGAELEAIGVQAAIRLSLTARNLQAAGLSSEVSILPIAKACFSLDLCKLSACAYQLQDFVEVFYGFFTQEIQHTDRLDQFTTDFRIVSGRVHDAVKVVDQLNKSAEGSPGAPDNPL